MSEEASGIIEHMGATLCDDGAWELEVKLKGDEAFTTRFCAGEDLRMIAQKFYWVAQSMVQ